MIALLDFSRWGAFEWAAIAIVAITLAVLFDLHKILFTWLSSFRFPVKKPASEPETDNVNQLIQEAETVKRELLLELRLFNSSLRGVRIDLDKVSALLESLAFLLNRLAQITHNHVDDAIAAAFSDLVNFVKENKDTLQKILDNLTKPQS